MTLDMTRDSISRPKVSQEMGKKKTEKASHSVCVVHSQAIPLPAPCCASLL